MTQRPSPDQAPPPGALQRLPAALQILTVRMQAALTERRAAAPGTEQQRHADEEVACLNDLYVRLQRRMEIPAEIWLLDGGRTTAAPASANALTVAAPTPLAAPVTSATLALKILVHRVPPAGPPGDAPRSEVSGEDVLRLDRGPSESRG